MNKEEMAFFSALQFLLGAVAGLAASFFTAHGPAIVCVLGFIALLYTGWKAMRV